MALDPWKVETVLAQFDVCANYNSWTDQDKAAYLKCSISGTAGQLLWDSGKPGAMSYQELRQTATEIWI